MSIFETVPRILFELLQAKRGSTQEVAELNRMRHNRDLCPLMRRQCEQILGAVERRSSVVYDIQGPGDSGVDVLVVLSEEEGETRYIGIQVKSGDEATSGVYEKLKAQWVDSQRMYGHRMLSYYIVLAWDTLRDADRIRNVEQAFSTIPRVRIVEPAFAANFLLRTSGSQVAAFVSSHFNEGDPILTSVRQATGELSARQLALWVEVLGCWAETRDPTAIAQLQASPFVHRTYVESEALFFHKGVQLLAGMTSPEEIPPIPDRASALWETLPEDLAMLAEVIDQVAEEQYLPSPDAEEASLIALDGFVRYRYHGRELRDYLFEVMSPASDVSEERLDTLVDMIWRAELSGVEAGELLGFLLRDNLSSLGMGLADQHGVASFDPTRTDDWLSLGRRIWAELEY